MAHKPDGDQGGDRVADDRQAQEAEEPVGQHSEFERELGHKPPRDRAQSPGESADRQNWRRERPVAAVGLDNGSRQFFRIEAAGCPLDPPLSGEGRLPRRGIGGIGKRQRRPAQQRGAQVARAGGRVAPAAVRIGMLRHPAERTGNGGPVRDAVNLVKRKCGDGGGQRAAGEFAAPVARVAALCQQVCAGRGEGASRVVAPLFTIRHGGTPAPEARRTCTHNR